MNLIIVFSEMPFDSEEFFSHGPEYVRPATEEYVRSKVQDNDVVNDVMEKIDAKLQRVFERNRRQSHTGRNIAFCSILRMVNKEIEAVEND